MTKITKKSEQQKRAEAEVEGFRKEAGPFVVAAETTRMPMLFTDAKVAGDPVIFANDSFLSLTGYDREEVLGKSFYFLMANDIDPKAQAQIEAAFGDGLDDSLDARCRRKDGAVFWAAVFIGPVRDAAGEVVQHFASFLDLSRHKREEEHLRFPSRRAEPPHADHPRHRPGDRRPDLPRGGGPG
jgi:PAS domain S-box-containing protein